MDLLIAIFSRALQGLHGRVSDETLPLHRHLTNSLLLSHGQILVRHGVTKVDLLAAARCIVQADLSRVGLRVLVRDEALLTQLLERLLVRRVRHDIYLVARGRLLLTRHYLRRLNITLVGLSSRHLRVRPVPVTHVRHAVHGKRGKIVLTIN